MLKFIMESINELKKLKEEIEKEIEETDGKSKKMKQLHRRLLKAEKLIEILEEIQREETFLNELHLLGDKDLEEEERKKTEKKIRNLRIQFTEKIKESDEVVPDNAIIEIRPGTGGEEASIFANDLLRMYMRYAEKKGWKCEILNINKSEKGIKLVTILLKGEKIYENIILEAGVHRVQRIPDTEANGRIHTSTATVAVLPEAEDVDVQIEEKDLKIEFFRSSGAGGQHVNKTESAVRLTHIPTGISVQCQDERSQHENKARAMKILKSKILESAMEKARNERDLVRKELIGSGDRSEKIKTYNFPQNRITDHRFGITFYNLEDVIEGNMDQLMKETQNEFKKKEIEQVIR